MDRKLYYDSLKGDNWEKTIWMKGIVPDLKEKDYGKRTGKNW